MGEWDAFWCIVTKRAEHERITCCREKDWLWLETFHHWYLLVWRVWLQMNKNPVNSTAHISCCHFDQFSPHNCSEYYKQGEYVDRFTTLLKDVSHSIIAGSSTRTSLAVQCIHHSAEEHSVVAMFGASSLIMAHQIFNNLSSYHKNKNATWLNLFNELHRI